MHSKRPFDKGRLLTDCGGPWPQSQQSHHTKCARPLAEAEPLS